MICKICKKTKKWLDEHKICKDCIITIEKAFIYTIAGKEVSREHFKKITSRGYLISEELDEDRRDNEI